MTTPIRPAMTTVVATVQQSDVLNLRNELRRMILEGDEHIDMSETMREFLFELYGKLGRVRDLI